MPLTPGLLYLAASIACSVTVAAMLKLARGWRIDVRQAIAVNYAVAATLCWALLRPASDTLFAAGTPWLTLAALGILLPSVFLAMAQAVRHAGVARSDAAQRLALFIPLIAAFLLFGETPDGRKLAAIALAFCALYCLLRRPSPDGEPAEGGRDSWLWPLIVWAGYGVIDVLFKQVARTGTAFSGALLLAFMLAGMLMLGYLVWRRARWEWRHALAGVALGLANFGNILTYIRAHQSLPGHPSVVFASMNMGVIALGALIGALAFRESLSRLNLLGLALALAAIVLMIPASAARGLRCRCAGAVRALLRPGLSRQAPFPPRSPCPARPRRRRDDLPPPLRPPRPEPPQRLAPHPPPQPRRRQGRQTARRPWRDPAPPSRS